MWLKISLYLTGLVILILPLTTEILRKHQDVPATGSVYKSRLYLFFRKFTKSGKFFLLFAILFTALQIWNEIKNSQHEILLIESERPIFNLTSTKIFKSKIYNGEYTIDFNFGNEGKRAVTNVSGRMYTVYNDSVISNESLPINGSDIYPSNKGFTFHNKMPINPDSSALKKPIYYYFTFTYEDLIRKTSYAYEAAMKIAPFKQGYCLDQLALCKEWEVNKIKRMIDQYHH